jgi:hypothetical protein
MSEWPVGRAHDLGGVFSGRVRREQPRYNGATGMSDMAGLNPAKCVSPENNRQPEQDHCDRHKRRAGDVSEQDEEDGDDGEDCCNVVVHTE